MTNTALKQRRAASWTRRQKQRELNREAQDEREKNNAALRAMGLPTPWEVAQAERRNRRAERLAKRRGRAA